MNWVLDMCWETKRFNKTQHVFQREFESESKRKLQNMKHHKTTYVSRKSKRVFMIQWTYVLHQQASTGKC